MPGEMAQVGWHEVQDPSWAVRSDVPVKRDTTMSHKDLDCF